MDDWIEALGGEEAYRRRYKVFRYAIFGVLGVLGGLLPAFLDGAQLANSAVPWILVGVYAPIILLGVLVNWFVPDPAALFDDTGP